jgi:hypothetical protein
MTHGRLVDVQYLLECSEKSFYHPTLIRSPALIVKDGSDKSRKQDIYSVNIRLLLLTEPSQQGNPGILKEIGYGKDQIVRF